MYNDTKMAKIQHNVIANFEHYLHLKIYSYI